ncbi:MAG: hypothetical protein AAF197_06700 [Pseudomonadota bacterium]
MPLRFVKIASDEFAFTSIARPYSHASLAGGFMRTRLTKRLFTLAALIAFLILSITASHAAEQSETAYQPTVFITGANRGMGL